MDNFKDIELLAKQVGLKPAQAEGLIYLFSGSPISNQDLLTTTGLSKSVLDNFRARIGNYLLPPSGKTAFSKEGRRWARGIKPQPFNWQAQSFEEIPKKLSEIFTRFKEKRLRADRELDQFRATKETVWRRVALMAQEGDLKNRRLLFLGDSDWTCLAAAIAGQAKRIFVVDTDRRVISDLEMVSKEKDLRVELLKYDLTQPLPVHLINNFDVVFSDPPYTYNGIGLFLSRSIEAVEKELPSRIYFCYGQSDRARERTLAIQALVNQLGLLIEKCLPKFNRYFGAASIGSSSSLYINSLTSKAKPSITGKFPGSIYTWHR
jgi:16S rRNA G966 N2-methylase RsmD